MTASSSERLLSLAQAEADRVIAEAQADAARMIRNARRQVAMHLSVAPGLSAPVLQGTEQILSEAREIHARLLLSPSRVPGAGTARLAVAAAEVWSRRPSTMSAHPAPVAAPTTMADAA